MEEKRMKEIIKDALDKSFNPFKKSIGDEMRNIKESMEFISTKFDEFKKTTEKVVEELKQVRSENQILKIRIESLEQKINTQEQREKQKNLIVAGVPDQPDEDTRKATIKILTALKVNINKEDIKEVYRIGKQKENRTIMLKLEKPRNKQEILNRVRETKGIKVQECGLQGENKNIYFNEDLTKQNQQLFKKARDYRKGKNYKSVYCLNGKIYLRKNDREKPIHISSEEDLNH